MTLLSTMTFNKREGFTLIELLLYSAITAIMLTSVVSFFFLFLNARNKNTAQTEVEQQGVFVMQYIGDSIYNASSVITPAIGASATELRATQYNAAVGDRRIYLDGTTLMGEDVLTSTTYPLTSDAVEITSLTFQNVASTTTRDAVTVTIDMRTANPSGRSEYDYSDTFTTTYTRR